MLAPLKGGGSPITVDRMYGTLAKLKLRFPLHTQPCLRCLLFHWQEGVKSGLECRDQTMPNQPCQNQMGAKPWLSVEIPVRSTQQQRSDAVLTSDPDLVRQ